MSFADSVKNQYLCDCSLPHICEYMDVCLLLTVDNKLYDNRLQTKLNRMKNKDLMGNIRVLRGPLWAPGR